MPLTPNDPRVKKANRRALQAAKADDDRHRLHAEAATDAASASPYWPRFVDTVIRPSVNGKGTLDQLIRQIYWPLCTVEVVDEISDACSAVHHAQDRNISVDMRDEKLQRDFDDYLEQINLSGFISGDCHNALFESPNALVVVDLPREQTTDFPEPYVYLLTLDQVQAIEAHKFHQQAGQLVFAFFDLPPLPETPDVLRRALYDSEAYSIYIKPKGGDWTLETASPHPLGVAPVFKAWSDVSGTNPLLSNTVLRPLLGKLDGLVFEEGAFRLFRLTSAIPLFWHLESENCDYKSLEGFYCEHGTLMAYNDQGHKVGTGRSCPRCLNKNKFGLGSRIPIPAPQTNTDADMRPPAGYIGVDNNALTFHRDWLASIRSEILKTATGYEGSPMKKAAVNEDQVMAILERARQVCQYLAVHFENLHRNLINTIGRLRYGDNYLGCTVDYGRRFSVLSSETLATLYKLAKEGGMSDWLLEEIDSMLQDFYARSDASRRLRYRMINDLNPYPFRTMEELTTAQVNVTDPIGFGVATGLSGLIRRFERENNMPIERFGLATDYPKRIASISQKLYDYVEEQLKSRPDVGLNPQPANPAGQQPGNGKPAGAPGRGKPAPGAAA
ncbi:hypothetical protein [Larkinella soli]|uniref:hypothetical protein n=1 Tax=Larkinella soli TaxID=1770527 RepID=UPI000FFC0150|nr:hypothetical protein [Larkinella soli]